MGFLGSSAGKESACNAGDPGSIPGWESSLWEGIGCPLQYSWASLVTQTNENDTRVQESTRNAGDLGLIPGLVRSPGGGHDSPLQYSCLETPHWQRSLAGYSPWGPKELDTTEWLSTQAHIAHRRIINMTGPTMIILKWQNGLNSFFLLKSRSLLSY